jgi:enterochelin esterase-like enzyme
MARSGPRRSPPDLTRILLTLAVAGGACAACAPDPGPPVLAADCQERGTLGADRVPNPTQGFPISFRYYLPPCYAVAGATRYPVIYLISMPYEARLDEASDAPMSLADRLIREGELGPAILIVPDDTVAYGYHAALARDLIPYVDSSLNTLADRRFRSVGGVSHGGAIAARMAFEFPDQFGSLGVFSGGIAPSEIERFDAWIAASDLRPRVLIDVGEQDGIFALTHNLLGVLDSHAVPYTLQRAPGGHGWDYWAANMPAYLRFLGGRQ